MKHIMRIVVGIPVLVLISHLVLVLPLNHALLVALVVFGYVFGLASEKVFLKIEKFYLERIDNK